MGNLSKLNDNHNLFINEYLYGEDKGNAAKCYANIYTNGEITKTTYSSASKLMSRSDIKNEIDAQVSQFNDLAKYRKIHNAQVLSDIISEMSTYQPTDQNGNKLSPHLARQTAIKGIEVQNKMFNLNEEKASVNVEGGMNFVFNLVAPSEDSDSEIQNEINAIKMEQGDYDEDDFTEFEEA